MIDLCFFFCNYIRCCYSQVIDEFGSFDSYCWSFMSNKPMVGGYRHTREVPLRTAKADAISQDLMRRGFLGVGPTVVIKRRD
jgi:DNA-3-methyladenine glycosylase I